MTSSCSQGTRDNKMEGTLTHAPLPDCLEELLGSLARPPGTFARDLHLEARPGKTLVISAVGESARLCHVLSSVRVGANVTQACHANIR